MPLLRQYAPTWLVQLPWLLSPADREGLQREVVGVTRERMLREMAEMIEALTSVRRVSDPPPLILALEDLHWSDTATLELLAYLARRWEAARLLVIATYRPVEVIVREHPLRGVKQELQQHGQSAELRLEGLTEGEVSHYLTQRFGLVPSSLPQPPIPNPQLPAPLHRLAHVIHQCTEGNPLFMVNVVDDLVIQGVMTQRDGRWELKRAVETVASGMPESLRQMLKEQIARLNVQDQQMLEAASVAGMEFSTAAVAAALEETVDQVEAQCEGLARREHFLRVRGASDWPDGTIATRYEFLHALYQDALYQRLPVGRRQRLHQRVGEREEAAYGDRVGEIAAELAVHFERSQDAQRAVTYLHQAAENAMRRSAHQEAIEHCTKGLELLQTLPDTPE
ncbi:MAG: ATP-binding protein, partial [Candidatus Binatia bacterium]